MARNGLGSFQITRYGGFQMPEMVWEGFYRNPRTLGPKRPNPKSKTQNPKSKIQNPKSKIQNPKSKIQIPKSKTEKPKNQTPKPKTKTKTQNPKSKIQNDLQCKWPRLLGYPLATLKVVWVRPSLIRVQTLS